MKKLIIAAIALIGFNAASFAQAAPATKAEPSKMKVVKKATDSKQETKVVPITKTATAPAAAKPAAAKTTTAASPIKKDGTPDKRFKSNAATTPAAGPVKKDGTPDKRYKANKKG
jgi:hypothetical protein